MRLLKKYTTCCLAAFKHTQTYSVRMQFEKIQASRFGGYQILLQTPLKFQTPKCKLRYGADGKYASLSMFVNDEFCTKWTDMEKDLLDNSRDMLSNKFGQEFQLEDYFGTSIRKSDWGDTLQLSIGVYNGKSSTTCFNVANEVTSYTSLCANKNVVVLLQVLGIWLKHEKAGIKCKLLEIKDYGFGQEEVFQMLPISDEED